MVYRMSFVPLDARESTPRICDFFRMTSVMNSFSVSRFMSLTSVGNSILKFSSSTKKVWTTNRMFAFSSSSVRGLLSPILSTSVQ